MHFKKSNHLVLKSLSAAILATLAIQPASASITGPIENALRLGYPDARYGKFKVNMRYRYELADVANGNNTENTAHANTLRARIGYLTPKFYGLQSFIEYEGNLAMQQDYKVPKGNWKGDVTRDVVADPQSSELNQFWLSYKGIPNTEIKGGRQRIILDDARFIGNVGWRQMEQTFDAVLLTNRSIANMTITAGYIGQIQNIFSQNIDADAPFVNISYQFNPHAKLTVYSYLVSYQKTAARANSTKTFGFTLKGSPKINAHLKLHYVAEYSNQSQYVNNPNSFNVDRYNIMAGLTFRGVTFKTGVEELGSNGTQAFKTPLATNHKFQGWADKFLNTPNNGVRDVTASVTGTCPLTGSKLMFVYHNFHSPVGNLSYGNEYDFLITKKFGKHLQLLAKYAFYGADKNAPRIAGLDKDTHKFWLQAAVNF